MPLIITPRQLTQRGELYHQLGQLVSAGIGLITALEMLGRNPPARSFKEPIRQIVAQMSQGATFSDALLSLGAWTPSFDIALISAGEKSGRLDAVLKLLGSYYADRSRMLRQMISDLAYPAFVFHFAILMFPFLDFFRDGRWGIYLLKTFGILIPLYAVILAGLYAVQGKRGPAWRQFIERALKPIPVLGTGRQYLALARLAASLEALINAGVTIIEAWDLAAAACGSPAIQQEVAAWKPRLLAGVTPAQAVSASPEFPEMFANLYHSGEISGKLDESLCRLRDYYQEEGTRKLHFVAQWVPRIIYLGVAALIAFKVIQFYSGYFNQINQIENGH